MEFELTREERERRRKAVDFAIANLKVEGTEIIKEAKERAKRYVNGQITLKDFVDG